MKICIKNDYIDYIHIPSLQYAQQISEEFGIPKEKFLVIPFGLDDIYEKYKDTKVEYENYSLAIGRSNRDYDFLIQEWKKIPTSYKLLIICDEYRAKEKLPENIILRKDIGGDEQFPYIMNCNSVIIPIKNENICSGDTVLLRSMSFYKAIIITKPSTLSEMYVEDGKNGFALEKTEGKFARELINILDSKNLQKVAECARKCFEEKYSRYKMGKIIGEKIKDKKSYI